MNKQYHLVTLGFLWVLKEMLQEAQRDSVARMSQ